MTNRVSKCQCGSQGYVRNLKGECFCSACGKPCSVVETGGDKDISFNCLNDCKNLIPSGGNFDNPDIGGCAVEYKFQPNTTLEHDSKLHTCPYYSVTPPADILTDENSDLVCDIVDEIIGNPTKLSVKKQNEILNIVKFVVNKTYPLAFAAGEKAQKVKDQEAFDKWSAEVIKLDTEIENLEAQALKDGQEKQKRSENNKLVTDDDFEHPNYPNKTLLRIIPQWELLATYQKNEYRLLCDKQRDVDRDFYEQALSEAKKQGARESLIELIQDVENEPKFFVGLEIPENKLFEHIKSKLKEIETP